LYFLIFEWYVDGEELLFDDEGRAWLQPILDWLNEHEEVDSASSQPQLRSPG